MECELYLDRPAEKNDEAAYQSYSERRGWGTTEPHHPLHGTTGFPKFIRGRASARSQGSGVLLTSRCSRPRREMWTRRGPSPRVQVLRWGWGCLTDTQSYSPGLSFLISRIWVPRRQGASLVSFISGFPGPRTGPGT